MNITFGSLMAFSVDCWRHIRLLAHVQEGPTRPLVSEGEPGPDPFGHYVAKKYQEIARNANAKKCQDMPRVDGLCF